MELYKSAIEQKQDEKKNNMPDDTYKIATVTSLFEDGCPKLTFVGEEQESSKKYSYIYTYIPSKDDNVLLIRANDTYVIIGKIAYNIPPYKEEEEEIITFTEEEIKGFAEDQISTHSFAELDRYGTINITTNTGINVLNLLKCAQLTNTVTAGFCGATPRGSYSISSLPSTADVATIITKVNSIISGLKSFGLFY